jgi:hypothetical protein
MVIDIVDTCHDAFPQLVFRGHSDAAQDRASELREEALDEI